MKSAAFLFSLLLALPAAAAQVAARIDGAPLHAFSVDAAWRLAQQRDAAATRAATLGLLVENRLLAAAARQRYGVAALTSGQRVAFTREVGFDDQLLASLRSLYAVRIEADLARLPGGAAGLLREQRRPSVAELDAVFGTGTGLRLDSTLPAAAQAQAGTLVLLRYAMPDGGVQGAITLADVYARQNVQGRVALFERDTGFMLQQARQQVASIYVRHWSERAFGVEAVADLRRVLADQADVDALMRMHGMDRDGHADSALLDRLAQQATRAEVREYYRRNRDQFVRIERVRARHIRLADERSARAVAAQLAGGAEFGAIARAHSIAPDAPGGGSLGWVRHDGAPDWLAQLLFSSPPNQVIGPVRTPAGPEREAPWEIVLVEQRIQGYQAADSESVRHVASRAIARRTAAAQLQSLRREVLRQASIELVPGAAP